MRIARRWGSVGISLLGAASVLGCGTTRIEGEQVEEYIGPIVGGAECSKCQWPAIAWIGNSSGDGCTATLAHPRLLTTAGHCLANNPTDASFGEDASGRTVKLKNCTRHPDYSGTADTDIAFCILETEVSDIPIVTPMTLCEANETLKPGLPVTIVGYGATEVGGYSGTKRWVDVKVEKVDAPKKTIHLVGEQQKGFWQGDSGGPFYVKMSDGTWRYAGAVSRADAPVAGSSAPRGGQQFASIPHHLSWIESASGIDLSPCHNGDVWAITPGCSKFTTNPMQGTGDWANGCSAGQILKDPAPTCGGGGAGPTGTGGAPGKGGATSAGGATSTGGALGKGGATGSGGVQSKGGATGTGGASSNGGAGAGAVGGAQNTGGTRATAGSGGSPGSSTTGGRIGASDVGGSGAVSSQGGTGYTGGRGPSGNGGSQVGGGQTAPNSGATGIGAVVGDDPDGCSCRVVGERSGGKGNLWVVLGALAIRARRLRRSGSNWLRGSASRSPNSMRVG